MKRLNISSDNKMVSKEVIAIMKWKAAQIRLFIQKVEKIANARIKNLKK